MIGREVAAREQVAHHPEEVERPTRVRLKGFSVPGRFAPLDLKVGKGEIVAIVGQLGSGADLVVEALAGLRRGYVGASRSTATMSRRAAPPRRSVMASPTCPRTAPARASSSTPR